jgi:hypothetical protein
VIEEPKVLKDEPELRKSPLSARRVIKRVEPLISPPHLTTARREVTRDNL